MTTKHATLRYLIRSPLRSRRDYPIVRRTDSSIGSVRNSLRRLARGAAVSGDKIVHRRLGAAFLVGDAGERERHFGACKRAHQHEVVDVAEMADAEIFSGIGPEARAVG